MTDTGEFFEDGNIRHDASSLRYALEDPELLEVARRVIWFKSPTDAILDYRLLLSHIMTYGTDVDYAVGLRYFSKDDFRDVLLHPLPGIFDSRSWEYWHLMFDISPIPPLPKRF